jgi:hypothetical protein
MYDPLSAGFAPIMFVIGDSVVWVFLSKTSSIRRSSLAFSRTVRVCLYSAWPTRKLRC